MSISITNLTKNYGTQTAVNNISFNVAQGEIVGFLGPNGAGKSTTMKMITGYLDADAGSIEVAGIKVNKENISSKQKIGYLPEANPLYFEMYVREYLHFVASIHQLNNANNRVEEIIKTVGLSLEANKKIGQLSKGYKQRVGLAAALIHEPEVLILDEPTSGLDPNQIIEIRNVIKALSKNKTVLFSSHILQEVEAICDRVIIINKGNIVANDTLLNLQKSNSNTQQVQVQFKEEVKQNVFDTLNFVSKISTQANNQFTFETSNAESTKKQLLQISINENLNILSIQTETKNLEAIFKELTENKS
jgi:ABC-2 type transport system ATP-binding protein